MCISNQFEESDEKTSDRITYDWRSVENEICVTYISWEM